MLRSASITNMEWEEVGSEDTLGPIVHEPFNFSLLCSSSRDTSRSWQANVVNSTTTCSEQRNCPPPEILSGNHCLSQSLAQIVSESLHLSVRKRFSVSAKGPAIGPATCHAQQSDRQRSVKWEQSDTADQALYLGALSSKEACRPTGLQASTQKSQLSMNMPVSIAGRSHQVCPSTPRNLCLQRVDQTAGRANSMAAATGNSSADALATIGDAAAEVSSQLPEPAFSMACREFDAWHGCTNSARW